MEELCRLCLTVSDELLKLADDNSLLQKIQGCLPITIVVNKSLPNQICKLCVEKVEDITEFQKKILKNDILLNDYLKNEKDLQSFYSKLKNKTLVKQEFETVFDYNDENSNGKHDFDGDNVKINTVKFEILDAEFTNNVSESSNNKIKVTVNESLNNKICDNVNESSINKITDNLNTIGEVDNFNTSEEIDNLNTSGDETSLSVLKRKKELDSKVKKRRPKTKPIAKQKDENKTVHDPFKCLMCFGILDSQINLYRHYSREHFNKANAPKGESITVYLDSGVAYKCSICGKEYSQKKSTERHLVVHTDDRPFYCNLCGRTYKTVQQIIQHGKVHSGFKVSCKFGCGYTSSYRGALKGHESRHHKKDIERKYQCEKCGKGFEIKTWYEQHLNKHNGLKPFVCDICGVSFHMSKYLTSHRTNVHPQSARVKKYICTYCSLPCDSMYSLTEHLKEHGIEKPSRFYLCDVCGKTCSDAEHLREHKNYVHLGIKPYKCGVCSKAFTKKFNLQVHERTHTGKKELCGCCGKTFSQQSSLKRHYCREHTGPDAFKCANCEKTFKKRRQFASHLKICV